MAECIAQRRPDGSFVIQNGTYHIPNEGEWKTQWEALNAQWLESPEQFEQLVEPEPVALTLEEAKAYKLQEINMACDTILGQLTNTYPEQETATFYKQEQEARAYVADPSSSTPLLSALAQGRGIPLEELAQRVLAKADAFAVASGSIIGQRQGYEDRIDGATILEEVEAIIPKYTLPGSPEPDQEAA